MKIQFFLGVVLAASILPGCERVGREISLKDSQAAETVDIADVDFADAGSILGKVYFAGTAPTQIRIVMDADPACRSEDSGPFYSEDFVLNEDETLKNVFVWVKQGLEDYRFETPKNPVVFNQRSCIFEPRILGVQTHQGIHILNSDPTTHNVHPLPGINREWNLSMRPLGEPLIKTFSQQEVMMPVKCNIHPWMKAYIGVVDHPYFGVTDEAGVFRLRSLPPGRYLIEAWHERLGTLEQRVEIESGKQKAVEFVFRN